MENRGRPIRPFPEPKTALARFAWLVRATRAYHPDADVRATRTFALKFSAQGYALKAETLNKLERGHLPFNTGIVRAYEDALQLEPWSLVDGYLYSARLQNEAPTWPRSLVTTDWDQLNALARGETLTATELLQITAAETVGEATMINSAPWRAALVGAVLDKFAVSFEGDERLLREALILLDEHAIPEILHRAKQDPLRYFNAIEALGFSSSPMAWEALAELAQHEMDPIQAQTLIEPVRRWLGRDASLWPGLLESSPALASSCLAFLFDPAQAFTAREEALALIRSAPLALTRRDLSRLDDVRTDLTQLQIRPVTHSRADLAKVVVRETSRALEEAGGGAGSPHVDGLSSLVQTAVYDMERVGRLGAATVLSASPVREAVGQALGYLLHHIDNDDYGTQRSIVRALTKARTTAGNKAMSRFASQSRVADEGLRLALAWALGLTNDPEDRDALAKFFEAGTYVTKQVAMLSWSRRNFIGPIEAPSRSALL